MAVVKTEQYKLTKIPGMKGKDVTLFLDRVKTSDSAKQLIIAFPDNREWLWKNIGQAVAESTITTFSASGCKWNCNTIKVFFDQLEGRNNLTEINLCHNDIRSVGGTRILKLVQSNPQLIHVDLRFNRIPLNIQKSITDLTRQHLKELAIVFGQLSRTFDLPLDITVTLYRYLGFSTDQSSLLLGEKKMGLAFFNQARHKNNPPTDTSNALKVMDVISPNCA